jgi:hypothetical protein
MGWLRETRATAAMLQKMQQKKIQKRPRLQGIFSREGHQEIRGKDRRMQAGSKGMETESTGARKDPRTEKPHRRLAIFCRTAQIKAPIEEGIRWTNLGDVFIARRSQYKCNRRGRRRSVPCRPHMALEGRGLFGASCPLESSTSSCFGKSIQGQL